jgi:hypothetical protein
MNFQPFFKILKIPKPQKHLTAPNLKNKHFLPQTQ